MPGWAKALIAAGSVVVVLVIVGIIGLVVFVNHATKNAEKVSNALIADIQADNPAAAYQLTTPAFQQVDSQAQVTQLIGQIAPSLQGTPKVTGKNLHKAVGSAELAIIVYSIPTSNGTKYVRVVVQHNKTWQVRNFRAAASPLSDQSAN